LTETTTYGITERIAIKLININAEGSQSDRWRPVLLKLVEGQWDFNIIKTHLEGDIQVFRLNLDWVVLKGFIGSVKEIVVDSS